MVEREAQGIVFYYNRDLEISEWLEFSPNQLETEAKKLRSSQGVIFLNLKVPYILLSNATNCIRNSHFNWHLNPNTTGKSSPFLCLCVCVCTCSCQFPRCWDRRVNFEIITLLQGILLSLRYYCSHPHTRGMTEFPRNSTRIAFCALTLAFRWFSL